MASIYKVTANKYKGGNTDVYYFLSECIAEQCCSYLNLQREYFLERYGFNEYDEYYIEGIKPYDDIDFMQLEDELKEKLENQKKKNDEIKLEKYVSSGEAAEAIRRRELVELARLKAKYEQNVFKE